MSSDPDSPKPSPKPPKPLPSAEEIQAYVELSAARTKKRLTLASGNARPTGTAAKTERKLPVGKLPVGELPVGGAAARPKDPAAPPAGTATTEADAADGAAWQPFSNDDKPGSAKP